ncbi:MAG: hypothetical protein ACP5RP_00485 [Candidatus Micrarchaeia archaeon]
MIEDSTIYKKLLEDLKDMEHPQKNSVLPVSIYEIKPYISSSISYEKLLSEFYLMQDSKNRFVQEAKQMQVPEPTAIKKEEYNVLVQQPSLQSKIKPISVPSQQQTSQSSQNAYVQKFQINWKKQARNIEDYVSILTKKLAEIFSESKTTISKNTSALQNEISAASKELNNLLSNLHARKPNIIQADERAKSISVPAKNSQAIEIRSNSAYVLPSLSLPDQISELEKIQEGLKQGIFNQDNINVVKEEVYSLYNALVSEQKLNPIERQNLTPLQQTLIRYRNKCLLDIIKSLKSNDYTLHKTENAEKSKSGV